MSTLMEHEIKRWTAKRKAVLVMEIIQGKATETEEWVDEAKKGMENTLRA
jgi:hypothetical protein